MTDRLNKIFAVLPSCDTFADIGCDHGYLAMAMLKSEKCRKVIVSDISAKCLKKAEDLLAKYIENGVAESVVSDGFDSVNKCDLALIAGMGGEEIIDILTRAKAQEKLPEKLVLQPMKNCDKVRLLAIDFGYKIVYDKVFASAKKFYNLMLIERGNDALTQEEIEFGRDNIRLKHKDFIDMISDNLRKYNDILESENLSEQVKSSVLNKIEKIKKYV